MSDQMKKLLQFLRTPVPKFPRENCCLRAIQKQDDILVADPGATTTIITKKAWSRKRIIGSTELQTSEALGVPARRVLNLVNGSTILVDAKGKPIAKLQLRHVAYSTEDSKESILSDKDIVWNGTMMCTRWPVNGGRHGIWNDSIDNKFFISFFTDLSSSYLLIKHPSGFEKSQIANIPTWSMGPDNVPYPFMDRPGSSRAMRTGRGDMLNWRHTGLNHKWNEDLIQIWRKRFNGMSDRCIKTTFKYTTQAVSSFAGERTVNPRFSHVRNLYLSRRKLTERAYADVVFIEGTSLKALFITMEVSRFAFIEFLPQTSANATTEAILKFTNIVGIPQSMYTDGGSNLVFSKAWNKCFTKLGVKEANVSPAGMQWKNRAERRWQTIQNCAFYAMTHVPNKVKDKDFIYIYCYNHMVYCHNHLSFESLRSNTPYSVMYGETSDLSSFRFHFCEPVWAYDNMESNGHWRWKKGYFMGVGYNTGAGIAHKVLLYNNRTVTRVIVQPRNPNDRSYGQSIILSGYESFPKLVKPFKDPPVTTPIRGTPVSLRQVPQLGNGNIVDPELVEDEGLHSSNIHSDSHDPSFSHSETTNVDTTDVTQNGGGEDEAATSTLLDGDDMVDGALPGSQIVIENTRKSSFDDMSNDNLNGADFMPTETQDDYVNDEPVSKTTKCGNKRKRTTEIQDNQSSDRSISLKNATDLSDKSGGDTDDEMNHSILNSMREMLDPNDNLTGYNIVIDGHTSRKINNEWKIFIQYRQIYSKDPGNDKHCEVPWDDMKFDEPSLLAKYITKNMVKSKSTKALSQWADWYTGQMKKSARRLLSSNVFHPSINGTTQELGLIKRAKKPRLQGGLKVKYGVTIPHTVKQALAFDKSSGNDLWFKAIKNEVSAVVSYGTFEVVKGDSPKKIRSELIKEGFQYIHMHMIFDVKQDGRHKARLVAGGHRFKDPENQFDTYCSNVKIKHLRYLFAIAQANNLDVVAGDVKNAYLYAKSKAKCFTHLEEIFGLCGFKNLTNKYAKIIKALYGLTTSGADWHDFFASHLEQLGFRPSLLDKDIWMRFDKESGLWEYVANYTDDILIFAMKAKAILREIAESANVEIKGGNTPVYHLGTDYEFINTDGVGRWSMSNKTYLKEALITARKINLSRNGKTLEGKQKAPLPFDYKPQNDTSDLLGAEGHKQFQSLIGIAVWLVTTTRADIAYAVNALSKYTAAPRVGHLEAAIYLFKYLNGRKHSDRLIVDLRPIKLPATAKLCHDEKGNWGNSYAHINLGKDTVHIENKLFPTKHGATLKLTCFYDANHVDPGPTKEQSVAGGVVFVGSFPLEWWSRRIKSICISSYEAEFNSCRIATEEVMSVQMAFHMLGVPIDPKLTMAGDNSAVVMSTGSPNVSIKKKNVSISYHFCRAHVAAGSVEPIWIPSSDNIADLYTKPLGHILFSKLRGELYVANHKPPPNV